MAGVLLTLRVLKSRQVDRVRTFNEALGIAFTEGQHGSGPRHRTSWPCCRSAAAAFSKSASFTSR
jgi:hypothetical protein